MIITLIMDFMKKQKKTVTYEKLLPTSLIYLMFTFFLIS